MAGGLPAQLSPDGRGEHRAAGHSGQGWPGETSVPPFCRDSKPGMPTWAQPGPSRAHLHPTRTEHTPDFPRKFGREKHRNRLHFFCVTRFRHRPVRASQVLLALRMVRAVCFTTSPHPLLVSGRKGQALFPMRQLL